MVANRAFVLALGLIVGSSAYAQPHRDSGRHHANPNKKKAKKPVAAKPAGERAAADVVVSDDVDTFQPKERRKSRSRTIRD